LKKALISGITGQDGAYLAEFLINKGYEVHGIKRRTSRFITDRVDHLIKDHQVADKKLILHYGDLTDSLNITGILKKVNPDEIYNLGAMSHVHVSFETPEYTANTNAIGCLRMLESIRLLGMTDSVKYYQASTSELFGDCNMAPQNENTPFNPQSPYAVAKLFAYHTIKNYRDSYNMFASNGILFNHESPFRGETFVTKKITIAAAKIYYGISSTLYLGNLNARRDWGHAKDYVRGMWDILQYKDAEDFVLATNKSYTIREFVKMVFIQIGVEIEFKGIGVNEVGTVTNVNSEGKIKIGQEIIKIDSRYYRPSDVNNLLGDYSKAKDLLGWEPKYDIHGLIKEMIDYDLDVLKP
jgi:GDPmannose 4,6-dehydratase